MVDDVLRLYRAKGGPGTKVEEEDLKAKEVAAEPGSAERGNKRKECDPKGPIGLLLESLHLHAAALDMDYNLVKWNEPDIQIDRMTQRMVAFMVRDMCKRDRTRVAKGSRQ